MGNSHSQIKQTGEEHLNECLNETELKQLEEWTGLKCSEVIFDSNDDDWSKDTSVLNERIIGKKQLIFLIEDDRGEKFGYYLNTEVVEKYWKPGDPPVEKDNKSFHFNLQSKNNRLNKPMKFEIIDLYSGGIELYKKSDGSLIWLGEILLSKENEKGESYFMRYVKPIEDNEIKKELYRKEDFIPKRILVIQMK